MKAKQNLKRLLSLFLALCLVFSVVGVPLASAAGEGSETTLYLKPNANWLVDNARYAAYFFTDTSNTWVSMTDADSDGYYEVTVPAGYENASVIFCRMNPGTTANTWDNKWNQTADLTVPTDGTNCYTVADGTWDSGGGTWSVYPPNPDDEDTPVPDTGATYIIAGSETLCGSNWDASDTNNKMTLEDGLYKKVYTNVAPGTYQFKVTDGTWDNSWGKDGGSANYEFVVSTACDVTITFNESTKEITVSGTGLGQAAQLTIEKLVAVGNGTGNWLNGANWDTSADANKMTATSDNIYEITFEDVPKATGYQVKFAANGSWDVNWGGTFSASGAATDAIFNSSTNITFDVTYENADVTLKLDLTGYDHSTKTGAKFTITVTEAIVEPATEYALVGYINGSDLDSMDTYKFVNGTLTVTFTQNSYVAIKSSANTNWYMTDGWLGEDATSATLYDASTLGAGQANKLFVPANVEVTFTLTENSDGTLTLSYTTETDDSSSTTVTIHFLKPGDWGTPINAWVWGSGGALPGYEQYNTTWPGSPISANGTHDDWYDLVIVTEEPTAFNFIFNNNGDAHKTGDLTTGPITGDTELWVVNGQVLTQAPDEWVGIYKTTIHFHNTSGWATVNAKFGQGDSWDAIKNYEQYKNNEYGAAIEANPYNDGWYSITIVNEEGKTSAINGLFNNGSWGDANQTGNWTTGKLTGDREFWYDNGTLSTSAPSGWFDINRTVHVPGTFRNPTWDAVSNQMTYDPDLGLYVITFENVAPGTYEFKIAINGSWSENYGENGVLDGKNIKVVVTTAQDVTIWYNDSEDSHRAVCSLDYVLNADITLEGTGIPDGTKLTDPNLTGLYSVTVLLDAGTYSDLTITYDGVIYSIDEFTMVSGKAVTFYFDPITRLAYHNGSDDKVDTSNIYYTTKDLDYKAPFGAVAAGEDVTFSITTGTDATAVNLIIKGFPSVAMTKDGEAVDGVQRWTCTTSIPFTGEYQYYFAISNSSEMIFYCDDNFNAYFNKGDYGEGTVCDADGSLLPYDLVVYVAGFETPDWMKDAVIYQIFPDRFYNADSSNDQAQTTARGEVPYEFVDWGLLPENPEQAADPNYPENAYMGDGEWSNEIYGGDLDGIIEKIDYLRDLGVTVIYLNPIFSSISNHRYDACDYMEIDPILGTLGDFEELVAAAEANDMHIILDGVFNHVSDDSVYFDRYYKFLVADDFNGKIGAYPYWAYVYDYMAANDASQETAEAAAKAYFSENYNVTNYDYTEWFKVYNTLGTAVDNIGLRAGKPVYSYDGWWGYDSMPIIYSTNGSEYQTGNWAEEIIYNEDGTSVTQYWISMGNDGWRLDVANEVSDETWQEFRKSVKALDSEAVIIGEIWSDATRYLMGDMYDSVMNYVFRDAVAGFARGYHINRDNKSQMWDSDYTAADALTTLEILRERYPEEAFYAMMNLMGSHDTARILSYLDGVEDDRHKGDGSGGIPPISEAFPTYENTGDGAKQLQYVVAFIQFTYAGAPTIYYGDEIGMVGADDPDDRRTFEWSVLEGTSEDDLARQELWNWYSGLAAIREEYTALRTGSVEPLFTGNDDVLGYIRSDSSDTLIVLANRASSEQTYELEGTWIDLVSGEIYTNTITIPAYRGVILIADEELDPGTDLPDMPNIPTIPTIPVLPDVNPVVCNCHKFTDINTNLWYHSAVCYVLHHGIMNGTNDGTTFSPYTNLSRAMLMTMLARLDGVNTTGGSTWYEKGLEWAVAEGVSDGKQPNADITREQVVTMLYRFAGQPVVSEDYLSNFSDGDAVSTWAKDAMNWAIANGIIEGKGNKILDPQGTATRAEVAQILANYMINYLKK